MRIYICIYILHLYISVYIRSIYIYIDTQRKTLLVNVIYKYSEKTHSLNVSAKAFISNDCPKSDAAYIKENEITKNTKQ